MWRNGVIDVNGIKVFYEAKVYDLGSVFGINEGRVSKLWLSIDEKCVANYDRGWDIEPTCEAAEVALAEILKRYE